MLELRWHGDVSLIMVAFAGVNVGDRDHAMRRAIAHGVCRRLRETLFSCHRRAAREPFRTHTKWRNSMLFLNASSTPL
jgi:hypothetical protein